MTILAYPTKKSRLFYRYTKKRQKESRPEEQSIVHRMPLVFPEFAGHNRFSMPAREGVRIVI